MILHGDPVVLHRDNGRMDFFTGGIELGGGEVDVVGLPLEWRIAHVDLGPAVFVYAAAFIICSLEPKAVEHLQFVAVLEIDPAVAPSLASPEGFEGEEELDMQLEGLEGFPGFGAAGKEFPLIHPAILPCIGMMAIKKDDGSSRGWRTFRRAVSFHTLQLEFRAGIGFAGNA